MNPHIDRARLLMQQSRFELAEEQLRLALTENSSDAESHALLALCFLERERFDDAEAEAQQAIVHGPDQPLGFHALASVQQKRGKHKQAFDTIHEAIRLEPWNEAHFGLLAAIEYSRYRWKECLEAAQLGLECAPEDVFCTNFRAMALTQLGRRDEAGISIADALAQDPDDAVTHANQGWRLLHERQPDQAMTHFREALRLEPNLEWARQGIIEAMKARHFIYRVMLAFFLRMGRMPPRIQLLLVVGLMFGNQIVAAVCQAVPLLTPFREPLIAAYLLFAWMTWVSSTLFNAVLCLNRFGRLALNRHEKIAAFSAVGCVSAGLLTGLTGQFIGSGISASEFWMTGMLWLGLVIPLSNAFHLLKVPGRRWMLMMGFSVGLGIITALTVVYAIRMSLGLSELQAQYPGPIAGADAVRLKTLVLDLMTPFATWFRYGVNGVVISTWLGLLTHIVPSRR